VTENEPAPKQPSAKSAAAKLGLSIHDDEGNLSLTKQSVLGAVGGWLGIIESILPATLFVTVLSITKQVVPAVIVAVSASVAFLILQIVRKKPLTNAIAGAVGIAISAFLPLRDGGQPADYFVQGFFTNLGYGSVLLISMAVRWPIIGVLIGFLTGEGSSWRKDKAQMRRFQAATGVWVGLFAARLVVQLPLYFSHQTELLGIFRIAMGIPLYALCLWLTWLLTRAIILARR
jgi:hypothetical protein